MPLDEAISFISRRYATFVEKGGPDKVGVKEEETKLVTSGSLVTAEKVSFGGSKPAPASSRIPANTSLPKEVVNIIGFLMDDRAMSIMEYDRLIKYDFFFSLQSPLKPFSFPILCLFNSVILNNLKFYKDL